MAVSKRVRYEVLRRDNHQCRYCGAAAPDVPLTVDHVIPVALGGSDDPSNLVTACRDCNSGKTSTSPDGPLVTEVNAKAAQWAEAMAVVAQRRAAERERREQITREFFEHWETHRESPWRSADMAPSWESSLMTFLDAGLEVGDIKELMVVALKTRTATDKWRYFCGCCWTRVRQAQAQASELLAGQDEPEKVGFTMAEDLEDVIATREFLAGVWKAEGFDLAMCLCGTATEFCGDYGCMLQLVSLANGALMGKEGLIRDAILLYPEREERGEVSDGA